MATMEFQYAQQRVMIGELIAEDNPHSWDLCEKHARKTTAPYGWSMELTHPGLVEGAEGLGVAQGVSGAEGVGSAEVFGSAGSSGVEGSVVEGSRGTGRAGDTGVAGRTQGVQDIPAGMAVFPGVNWRAGDNGAGAGVAGAGAAHRFGTDRSDHAPIDEDEELDAAEQAILDELQDNTDALGAGALEQHNLFGHIQRRTDTPAPSGHHPALGNMPRATPRRHLRAVRGDE